MLEPGHMNPLTHALPRCPRCGSRGPFYRNRAARSGWDGYCISCRKAISTRRYADRRRLAFRRCLARKGR